MVEARSEEMDRVLARVITSSGYTCYGYTAAILAMAILTMAIYRTGSIVTTLRMPESASRLTDFLMRVRLGRDTRAAVRPRKMRAHGSARPASRATRPPYCSSTARARKEASVVKEEKTSKTGRYQPRGGAAARNGPPEKKGTRGSSRTDSSGSAPAAELLEVSSHPVAAALARARDVSSLCVIGAPGRNAEKVTVSNCSRAMTGQMRKTKGAGVIRVAKSWLKALLVVGPTALVMTVLSVATIGPIAGICMVCMVIEMRPK